MKNCVSRARNAWQLAVLTILLLSATNARAIDSESLHLLLLGAQDMNTPQTVLRADIAVALETYKGPRTTQAIAFFVPGKEANWYLQLKEPALAALVRGSERKVVQRTDGSIKTSSIGEPIADLGVSYEDLSRFIVDDFKLWQIADDNGDVVLAGRPPPGRVGVRLPRLHLRQDQDDPAQGAVLRQDLEQPREAPHRLGSRPGREEVVPRHDRDPELRRQLEGDAHHPLVAGRERAARAVRHRELRGSGAGAVEQPGGAGGHRDAVIPPA